MTPDAVTIEHLRSAYAQCFGCGTSNVNGLRLDGFTVADGAAQTEFTAREEFSGFEGVLHGGVVATALDEISAWAAMLTEGVFVYTARLNISYRSKVPTDAALTLHGKVTERRGRRLSIEASILSEDKVLAQSEGVFVVAGDIADATNATQ